MPDAFRGSEVSFFRGPRLTRLLSKNTLAADSPRIVARRATAVNGGAIDEDAD